MENFAVLIPTKTASNLIACANAVWENEHDNLPIIVVDDGLQPNEEQRQVFQQWDRDRLPLWMSGEKPFCFSRNINIGIRKANSKAVIVLNDDAILQTRGGFSLLQQAAEEHPEYGIISATTNNVGNPAQNPRGIGLREEPRVVAFIAVLIPRRTIEAVGLMDEQFGGIDPDGKPIYGFCDNDYCRRVLNAGLKIGIHDGCFVDHKSLPSTFRGEAHRPGDVRYAAKLYLGKWGESLPADELRIVRSMAG